jgi:hypothetical protein
LKFGGKRAIFLSQVGEEGRDIRLQSTVLTERKGFGGCCHSTLPSHTEIAERCARKRDAERFPTEKMTFMRDASSYRRFGMAGSLTTSVTHFMCNTTDTQKMSEYNGSPRCSWAIAD